MKKTILLFFIFTINGFQDSFSFSQADSQECLTKSVIHFTDFEFQTYNNGATADGDLFITTANITDKYYKALFMVQNDRYKLSPT